MASFVIDSKFPHALKVPACEGTDAAAWTGAVILTPYLWLFAGFYFSMYSKESLALPEGQLEDEQVKLEDEPCEEI